MMEGDFDFLSFLRSAKSLTVENRPLRMRLAHPTGVVDDVLLPQRIVGCESMCGGLDYRIDCVATDATLELKQFITLPVELQLVTDRGELHKICGIVTEVRAGHSDGGLATYQLTMRDAMALLEQRVNTRVFRRMNEIDIIEVLFSEWRQKCGAFAAAFDIEIDQLIATRQYPRREFTKQHNEDDASFIRRLMKRRGISWFFRAGQAAGRPASTAGETPVHTLILFDDASRLQENAAGTMRFHRNAATELRDSVTAWSAVRTLQAAGVSRHSWDHLNPKGTQFMTANVRSTVNQGEYGNAVAACIDDYFVDAPHVGDDHEDQVALGRLQLQRHDLLTKCFYAESGVRDLRVGESNVLSGHPEIDTHPQAEREFVVIELHVAAENNLSSALDGTVRTLLARNRWDGDNIFSELAARRKGQDGAVRYSNRFTCVRSGIAIVPAYDPRVDLPRTEIETGTVVGPPGEEIYCDELGRVKVRFPGTRPEDHQHADGAGAADTDADSAWVRDASNWAGPGPGSESQTGTRKLPRVGTEALIAYLGGDPDKPIILGQLYNRDAPPPGLGSYGGLPGSKCQSGIQSCEVHGKRVNQLRLDDTPGQISVQLASEHAVSELNLGYLTHPRVDGEGKPRGEGAELRSDEAVAVRGAKGLLLSADAHAGAQGALLDRAEMVGVIEVLRSVTEQLATFAAKHAGDAADSQHLAQLIDKLKTWDRGSNVDGGAGTGGGAAILAASAPAGVVVASQENLALGAANKIDLLCGGDTQLSTGRRLLMRATEGISLFALRLGMKLIAATGSISVQAQDGNIEVTTGRRIKLIAVEGIDIEAPEVKIVTKGARADYGGGKVTHQCTGDFAIKSARFVHSRGGDGNPAGVQFPSSLLETDDKVMLFNPQTGRPVKGRSYTLTQEGGKTVTGVTDESGHTNHLTSDMLDEVGVSFHPPEDAS
jgi:type VI secretion system secreted protein VgrG